MLTSDHGSDPQRSPCRKLPDSNESDAVVSKDPKQFDGLFGFERITKFTLERRPAKLGADRIRLGSDFLVDDW